MGAAVPAGQILGSGHRQLPFPGAGRTKKHEGMGQAILAYQAHQLLLGAFLPYDLFELHLT
jgi:hypothetical protein